MAKFKSYDDFYSEVDIQESEHSESIKSYIRELINGSHEDTKNANAYSNAVQILDELLFSDMSDIEKEAVVHYSCVLYRNNPRYKNSIFARILSLDLSKFGLSDKEILSYSQGLGLFLARSVNASNHIIFTVLCRNEKYWLALSANTYLSHYQKAQLRQIISDRLSDNPSYRMKKNVLVPGLMFLEHRFLDNNMKLNVL